MRDLEELVADVEPLWRALRSGAADQDVLQQLFDAVLPAFRERARRHCRQDPQALADGLVGEAWEYWFGKPQRLTDVAIRCQDAGHFVNALLLKVTSKGIDCRRRQRTRAWHEQRVAVEEDARGLEGSEIELREDAAAVLRFLVETRCGPAALIAFRYRCMPAPPDSFTDAERALLEQRGVDPVALLGRSWIEFPPPVEEIADALRYDDRNAVDRSLSRARARLRESVEALREVVGDGPWVRAMITTEVPDDAR